MTTITTDHLHALDTRPCPAWCSLPEGHIFDAEVCGDPTRDHEALVGTVASRLDGREVASVYVTATETATDGGDGPSTVSFPIPAMLGADPKTFLAPQQAGELAVLLKRAERMAEDHR